MRFPRQIGAIPTPNDAEDGHLSEEYATLIQAQCGGGEPRPMSPGQRVPSVGFGLTGRTIAVTVIIVLMVALARGQSVADYQKQAIQKFPALAEQGSPLHSKFVELFNAAKTGDPVLLKNPSWPVVLAERASVAISKRDEVLPGTMKGRVGGGRAKAMADNKMKAKSEEAVLKGLAWLQKSQNADGSWGDANKGAMTGFALLCFLGHGETPKSEHYGLTVKNAVQWIIDNGTKNEGHLHMSKSFNQPGVYEHGICTYALGEYYTMTKDDRVKDIFKQAIAYIVQGQGLGGVLLADALKRTSRAELGVFAMVVDAKVHARVSIPKFDRLVAQARSAT